MSGDVILVIVVITALAFDFTNGFHDTANAIATSVSTRAMSPRTAVLLSAVLNFAGAFISLEVAATVASGIVDTGAVTTTVVFAGLVGAIVWNLATWWLGLPSSSSHALIGGLAGAGLASSTTVHWDVILDKVVIPMVVSPLVGFGIAYLVMLAILWGFRRANAHRTTRRFRHAQTLSAAAVPLGHGLQDAQKRMGVIVLALAAGGLVESTDEIPLWVVLSAATAIALG